jgi:hypothetical protein
MGEWLADRNRERTEEVRKMKPKKGQFVQLDTWFGDVWAEIESVFGSDSGNDWLIVWTHRNCDIRGGKCTDWEIFYHVRKISKTIPQGCHILTVKEGRFGGRKGKPFSELPDRIKKKFDKGEEAAKLSV